MIDIMPFRECEEEFLRKVSSDREKVKAIAEAAEKRYKFVESIKPTANNISFILENHYEIIKELLIALLLKDGLRSKNHQCLFSYFYKRYPQYEYELNLILRLSFLRNRLEYYGELIDKSFYDTHLQDLTKIVDLIKKLAEE